MDARVELVGVTKTYPPNVRALRGVSAAFEAGKVSTVLGANGSGKSTLLAIVATLTRATAGRVSHAGLGKGKEVRRTLGWVGHDALCYADLSGRENIELAARLHGIAPDVAYESARVRFPTLAQFAERPFRTYSRGQRQRVALARALVHAPRLLLLDEPTTGLDSAGVDTLAEVVRGEAMRGAVVLVVTHDSGFAERVGDAGIVLEGGKVKSV